MPTSIDEVIQQAARRDKAIKEHKEKFAKTAADGSSPKKRRGTTTLGRAVAPEDGGANARVQALLEVEPVGHAKSTTRLEELRRLGTIKGRSASRGKCKKRKEEEKFNQDVAEGVDKGLALKRARNIRDLLIEPQQFTIDKILMLLDIKRLKKLGQEFENIIEHDKEMEERERRWAR